MKGDPLPDRDHISRYCRFTTLVNDQPSGASFMLRPAEEFLSVNWLEFFGVEGRQEQMTQVRKDIRLKLAPRAKFAVLDVGNVIEYVKENGPDNRILSVLHEPNEDDPSHSGIHGYGLEDDWIADLISEVVQETHPAKEPRKGDAFQ